MPNIEELYLEYFQKSKVFLYPALGIPCPVTIKTKTGLKHTGFSPVQTFLSWPEYGITHREKKLVCVFNVSNTEEFSDFERVHLKKHPLYRECKYITGRIDGDPDDREANKGIYIFDFGDPKGGLISDWHRFTKGQYSKLSTPVKRHIKEWFKNAPNKYVYVDSFINPDKFYVLYARLWEVSVEALKDAVELTDKPNFRKETLVLKVKFNKLKTV